MPSADFCCPVRIDHSTLSPDSETNGRSPEVSSTAFRTQPADLQPVPLMDMGFAVIRPLARHRMPLIRFLYIGSYVCSTLLSDPASRRRRCASLSLHLHQVVKRTFTSKLSNMLGTHEKPRLRKQPGFSSLHLQKLILPNTVVLERACGDEDGSLSILGLCSDFYVSKRVPTTCRRHRSSGPHLGHICAGTRGKTGHQQPAKALKNQHRVQL